MKINELDIVKLRSSNLFVSGSTGDLEVLVIVFAHLFLKR